MSDNDAWYYMLGEEVLGPISLTQLRELALTNVVNQKTLVYTSGMAEWRAACDTGISRFFPPLPKFEHWSDARINRGICILQPLPILQSKSSEKLDPIFLLIPFFDSDLDSDFPQRWLHSLRSEIVDQYINDYDLSNPSSIKEELDEYSISQLFDVEVSEFLVDTAYPSELLYGYLAEYY